ncbi:MAG: RNA polymerase sigma factor [Bacteroidetes bacterium]|nr:RNA polymerase sigma factor [Bacteroidota bacterium]
MNGDRSAFAALISQTEGLVAGMIFQMTGGHAEVKDLAQDIYFQVYKGLPSFRFGAKLSTWVGQIAYHACLRWLKKRKMVLTDVFEEVSIAGGNEPSIDELFFQNELKQQLSYAITMLPTLYRTLVTLYHTDELSYQEITAITGLPEGTVKSYLFRARRQLRDQLVKNYREQ